MMLDLDNRSFCHDEQAMHGPQALTLSEPTSTTNPKLPASSLSSTNVFPPGIATRASSRFSLSSSFSGARSMGLFRGSGVDEVREAVPRGRDELEGPAVVEAMVRVSRGCTGESRCSLMSMKRFSMCLLLYCVADPGINSSWSNLSSSQSSWSFRRNAFPV
jgi:hypothetical protein